LSTRERVLDAVGDLLRGEPWGEVTMTQVADRAGLSRQTVYNEFGSRPELAQAYVIREADRMLEAVSEAVLRAPQPREALQAAFETFLGAAQHHPVLAALQEGDGNDELLALVTVRGGPLLVEVTRVLSPVLRENWSFLRDEDIELIVETMVRLAISHATLPAGSPRETADALTRILGPYLDELVAAG
jgi:AcrR family transcriptional regulator